MTLVEQIAQQTNLEETEVEVVVEKILSVLEEQLPPPFESMATLILEGYGIQPLAEPEPELPF